MTETEHYKLKKPAGNEYVSPGPFNDNADILDAALHELDEKTGNLDYVPNSEKGAPNGVATLGAEGTIPPEQIPGGTADAAVEAHNTSEDPHANCGFIRAGAGEPVPPVPVNADLLEGHDAAYFVGLVDAALPKTGGTMTGNISMGGHRITDLSEPKAETDPARVAELDAIRIKTYSANTEHTTVTTYHKGYRVPAGTQHYRTGQTTSSSYIAIDSTIPTTASVVEVLETDAVIRNLVYGSTKQYYDWLQIKIDGATRYVRLSAAQYVSNIAVETQMGSITDPLPVTAPINTLAVQVLDGVANLKRYAGAGWSQIGAQIATGSYTGTGTYGSSNPCSLTFSFVPKLVMVQQENSGYFPSFRTFYGETTINGYQGYSATQPLDGIWNNKTLSWYSARSAEYQFNYNGRKYNYIAFG